MHKARVWFHVTERPIEMTAARSKDESQWTSGKSLLLLHEAQHRQAEGHTTGASHPPTHSPLVFRRRVPPPPAIHFLYLDVLPPFRLSSDPLTSRIWSPDPYLITICNLETLQLGDVNDAPRIYERILPLGIEITKESWLNM